MPMAFGNPGSAIDRRNPAVLRKKGFVRTQSHRASEVAAFPTQLQFVSLHPLRHQSDHRLAGGTEFGRARILNAHQISRRLNNGHLHAKTNTEIGNVAGACEGGGTDFAFRTALPKSAGYQDSVDTFKMRRQILTF